MRRLSLSEAQQRLNVILGPVDWRLAHPGVKHKGDEKYVSKQWVSKYMKRRKSASAALRFRRKVRTKQSYAVKQIRRRRNQEMWRKHPMFRQLPFRFFLGSRQAKW